MLTMSTSAAPYHHGQLRAALLDAAYALLQQQPAHQISLRAIARIAGVSHAAPYNHFPDRSQLLVALAQRCMTHFYDAQAQAVESVADPGEQLLALGEAYVRYAVTHPNDFQLIFDPAVSPAGKPPAELAPLIERHRTLLTTSVRNAMQAGRLPPGDPAALAAALWSTVHGLAHLMLLGQLPAESAAATLSALVTRK